MTKRIKLAFVGGGSFQWAPRIIQDIMMKEDLQDVDFYLLDLNLENAGLIQKMCEKMNDDLKTNHRFIPTNREDEAYEGSDFVVICISTGGFHTMKHDLSIPEKYGIFATVGDTVGPGGWSRNLRNIPVFNDIAKKVEKLSPHAVVLNYTNPMACLTKAFYEQTKLRTVGLCHGLFENYSVMMKVFGLEHEEQLKIRFGGVNHFFWILDFKVNGQDGYDLLRQKLSGGKRFVDLINDAHQDEGGFSSNKYLTSELFETFGYLPYVGDRHTCEFLPHVITGNEEKLKDYRIQRTTIEERQQMLTNRKQKVIDLINGERSNSYVKSRETAADIIEAVALGKEFIDIINVPNIGQLPSLPLGGIVETLGVINTLGFTPITAGPLPEPINRIVLPHLVNSEIIYQAATEGDFELALQALHNDPSCAHLDYRQIRNMAGELINANKEFLPQF